MNPFFSTGNEYQKSGPRPAADPLLQEFLDGQRFTPDIIFQENIFQWKYHVFGGLISTYQSCYILQWKRFLEKACKIV
jgi:hypothetical protein